MAEPQCDDSDIHAGLQQVHRCRVAASSRSGRRCSAASAGSAVHAAAAQLPVRAAWVTLERDNRRPALLGERDTRCGLIVWHGGRSHLSERRGRCLPECDASAFFSLCHGDPSDWRDAPAPRRPPPARSRPWALGGCKEPPAARVLGTRRSRLSLLSQSLLQITRLPSLSNV